MGKLTNKQQAFVTAYLGPANLNANEAARLAGYKGQTRKAGYDVMRSPVVAARIREALQKRHLSSEEVLARLSDIARCSLEDFVTIDAATGKASLDLGKARDRELLHVFDSIEVTSQGGIKIKRYSALDALEKLARIDKRFTIPSPNLRLH